MDPHILSEEQEYLVSTLSCLSDEQRDIDRRFAEGIFAGDELAAESIRQILEHRFRLLKLAEGAPYFARIDFDESTHPLQQIYLGKTTVYDGDRRSMVVDWRAPVATLYYECRLGKAGYDCPEGHIDGQLTLKRQLEVRQSRLLSYEDIDITSDDELLRPYLSVSSDARLKNIIATIQREQNRIIRADLSRPLIVQGVAGSGKTTVALHRIAYLVYTYAESFDPEHFMILAPGGFFLRYIANVLPDLGVENVRQLTYEDLVKERIKLSARVAEPSERLFGSDYDNYVHDAVYKSSRQIFFDIDAFLEHVAPRFFPQADFVAGISVVATRSALFDRFMSENIHLPYFERLKVMGNRLSALVSDMHNGRQAARNYIRSVKKPGIPALYQEFLAQLPDGTLKAVSTERKSAQWEYEDLTPLLYMQHRVLGARDRHMRHIVIDEAQDFSPRQLWLLKELFPTASFTILGDLAQGIYQQRGVTDWESVNNEVWDGQANIALLQKSYRTTIEIMAEANKVLRRLPGVPEGQAVIRHGPPVQFVEVFGLLNRAEICIEHVAAYRAQGHQNIAVITRDADTCKSLSREMKWKDAGIHVLTGRDAEYTGGVCMLPAALSKGLEFDAVIVADHERYKRDRTNTHLLYVAMTRAMHALTVLYET